MSESDSVERKRRRRRKRVRENARESKRGRERVRVRERAKEWERVRMSEGERARKEDRPGHWDVRRKWERREMEKKCGGGGSFRLEELKLRREVCVSVSVTGCECECECGWVCANMWEREWERDKPARLFWLQVNFGAFWDKTMLERTFDVIFELLLMKLWSPCNWALVKSILLSASIDPYVLGNSLRKRTNVCMKRGGVLLLTTKKPWVGFLLPLVFFWEPAVLQLFCDSALRQIFKTDIAFWGDIWLK